MYVCTIMYVCIIMYARESISPMGFLLLNP